MGTYRQIPGLGRVFVSLSYDCRTDISLLILLRDDQRGRRHAVVKLHLCLNYNSAHLRVAAWVMLVSAACCVRQLCIGVRIFVSVQYVSVSASSSFEVRASD